MPITPLHPYSPYFSGTSLVTTHIYLFSITFPLRPNEAATVWWLQKLVFKYLAITTFQHIKSYHIIAEVPTDLILLIRSIIPSIILPVSVIISTTVILYLSLELYL